MFNKKYDNIFNFKIDKVKFSLERPDRIPIELRHCPTGILSASGRTGQSLSNVDFSYFALLTEAHVLPFVLLFSAQQQIKSYLLYIEEKY